MSKIYGIHNVTTGKTWYEASFHLLEEIEELAPPEKVSFFSDYDFEPECLDEARSVPAHQLAPQLSRLIAELLIARREAQATSKDQPAPRWQREHLLEFFDKMLTECREHPDHQWASYAYE